MELCQEGKGWLVSNVLSYLRSCVRAELMTETPGGGGHLTHVWV